MYRPLPLAGGSKQHKDKSYLSERTINFLPQAHDGASFPTSLESFYGLKTPFATVSGGFNRGMFAHKEVLYKLQGTTLYSFDSSGSETNLGTISGTSRAVFAGLGDSVVIAVDNNAYEWNGSTLTAATDPDFETPQTVTVINKQAIYDGDNDRFAVSDVGSPLNINALNYATAENRADDLLRPYAFNTTVLMLGSKTIEQWRNDTSVSDPPFSRLEGATINIGLGAVHSVAEDDRGVYFLGNDFQVYYWDGGFPVALFPNTEVRQISDLSVKSDAVGWCMNLNDQWFYVIKFPAGDRTWILPRGGIPFELSSGNQGGKYNGDSYANVFGKHLIADEVGNILELDLDTYTENGDTIRRVRVLPPVSADQFGRPGAEIEVGFLKLVGRTGTGNQTGDGSDPEVMLRYSDDGENWSTEIRADVGKLGVETELIFDINQTLPRWVFEIVQTDPVYAHWHSIGMEFNLTNV